MPEQVKQIFAYLENLIRSGYRNNAFSPWVWYNAIIDPILMVGAYIFKDLPLITYTLIFLMVILVFSTIICYFIFVIKKPAMLQSEKYKLENKKLDLIATKGEGIIVNPVSINLAEYKDEKPEQLKNGE